MSNTIKINGVTITTGGKSLVVSDGKVIVDGKTMNTEDEKIINIEVHGDIDKIDVDVCRQIEVEGNVGDVRTSQGNITINGSAMDTVTNSQGSIKIEGDVNGDVKNSMGTVKAGGNIYGKVKTSMGSIKGQKIYVNE